MQAYSKTDLYNKYVQEQATEALQTACLCNESYNKIIDIYPVKLYTPNFFIRIALGLLTIIAVLFSGLLLFLLFSSSDTRSIKILLIFFALICYITLELLVKSKRYYNAGVDNMLMILVMAFMVSSSFSSAGDSPFLGISSLAMIVALWLSIRFTDAFMAMICYCCFFIFLFLLYLKAGYIATATAPFMMMAVSALVYLVMKKLIEKRTFMFRRCFKAITLLTLITFYAAGNYFVVKELSNHFFHLQLTSHEAVPLAWLFWIFTLIIPPAYIIYGLIKKDLGVMRTGLVLIAATIFTIKQYYTIFPLEVEMLIAGAILIAASYSLIKYLTTPKHGYASADIYRSKKEMVNMEALIVAETFNKQPSLENPALFGGGSGGGGGATGQF